MVDVTLKFHEDDKGTTVESFSDAEAKRLSRLVTNVNSNIYAIKIGRYLPPEQAGALQSRYSRTSLTGRALLLKEFLPNRNKGREFFKAWLADFGDDSIQEMPGGLPLSCEFISDLAAMKIEESRIGASFIRKSTRYVAFDKKLPNGEFMFYNDKRISESKFSDEYTSLMRALFESYTRNMPVMQKYVAEINPFEEQTFSINGESFKLPEFKHGLEEKLGISEEELKKAYDSSVKAYALDLLRDYLPLSTLTHMGISMNARAYDNLISKLSASQLAEFRWIGKRISVELEKLAPSLIGKSREKYQNKQVEFLTKKEINIRNSLQDILSSATPAENPESCSLFDYTGYGTESPDAYSQTILASQILHDNSRGLSISDAKRIIESLSAQRKKEIITAYVGDRKDRRQKPGRAFESVNYSFDLTGRIGILRDYKRHRIGTQIMQPVSPNLGFEVRKQYDAIGISDDYRSKMAEVKALYDRMYMELPDEAQYVVTFGFKSRWSYSFNARQAFHLIELRTSPQGHEDYRRLTQDIYRAIDKVHPTIASYIEYVNLKRFELGRLNSEIRIALKRKQVKKTA